MHAEHGTAPDLRSPSLAPDDTEPDLPALYAELRTHAEGLTSAEAEQRLKQFGFNEPVTVQRRSRLGRFLAFFGSPLALILLVAAVVTGILGDPVSATIIAVIVVASATLDFVQTQRSQNAAEKLRNQVVLTATARRDGQERLDLAPSGWLAVAGWD